MKTISFSLFLVVALSNTPSDLVTSNTTGKTTAKEFIKVYPTPDNKGSITIHSATLTPISFYLFDLEGKLVYETIITKNEKQTVEGLTNGTYLYNAFQADKKIEGGNIVLK